LSKIGIRGPRSVRGTGALVLVLTLVLTLTPVRGPAGTAPTFQSLLTRDLSNLAPAAKFSLNDKIHLYTVWTGLRGSHALMVKWVRPDGKAQETTRFKFSVPPGDVNYRTWAWLSFKKSLLNVSTADSKFVGPWKARLFLDEKLVAEYPFQVF
jgi:hypothetical protein